MWNTFGISIFGPGIVCSLRFMSGLVCILIDSYSGDNYNFCF